MEIRPHRRIVVPFEPPYFDTLSSVAEFAGDNHEHFGGALFGPGALAGGPLRLYHRMCASLGVKMIVDCRTFTTSAEAVSAAGTGADFVVLPQILDPMLIPAVTERLKEGARAVFPVSGLGFPDLSGLTAVMCDRSLVAEARKLGEDLVVIADGLPDADSVVEAVKAGANLVVVGDYVIRAEKPGVFARELADRYREFT